jgi:hypothetical protein
MIYLQIHKNERSRFNHTTGCRMRTRQEHIHRGCKLRIFGGEAFTS